MYDEKFMRRAIELSAQALDMPGAWPYGAVVVKDGRIVGEGLNRSSANFDPDQHAERKAILDACSKLDTPFLTGCVVYASCQPCPLCTSSMMLAGIGELYYGVSLEEADHLVGRGNAPPLEQLRRQAALGPETAYIYTRQRMDGDAIAVLNAWAKKHAQ